MTAWLQKYFAIIDKDNGESSSRKKKPKLTLGILIATDNAREAEVQFITQEIKKQVALEKCPPPPENCPLENCPQGKLPPGKLSPMKYCL